MGETLEALGGFLGIAFDLNFAHCIMNYKFCNGSERAQMNALIAMRGIDTEGQQSRAHIMSRLNRRCGIRTVITEHILLDLNVMLSAKLVEFLRQMVIERSGLVCHGKRDAELR